MIYLIIGLFALAAVLGLVLILQVATRQKPPRPAVYIHGILAVFTLTLLVYYSIKNAGNGHFTTAITLFVIAALGGLTLYVRDLKNKVGPVWLAVLHALAAVCGFVSLLFQVL